MSDALLLAVEFTDKALYAVAAALAILVAAAAAIGMGMAISKALEAIGRQPESEKKIRNTLILGLVFIETAIIYALVISILIVINVL